MPKRCLIVQLLSCCPYIIELAWSLELAISSQIKSIVLYSLNCSCRRFSDFRYFICQHVRQKHKMAMVFISVCWYGLHQKSLNPQNQTFFSPLFLEIAIYALLHTRPNLLLNVVLKCSTILMLTVLLFMGATESSQVKK